MIGTCPILISLTTMVLSNEQIQEFLKNPKNKAGIQKAIEHEDHIQFHSNIVLADVINNKGVSVASVADAPYYQKYLNWVASFLNATDKFEQFKKLLTFPITTNEVIDNIADEYIKVFDAQDSFFIPELTDQEQIDDFLKYFDYLKESEFWKGKAFKAMMSSISSILIVDLPLMQTGGQPEPYFYLLDIRKVVDIITSDNGDIEYIIFSCDSKNYAVFDSLYYRVYNKDDKGNFGLILENKHDLGYCPAKFFWSDTLDNKYPEVKHAPISSLLSRLDWYLFFETAKENLDIYAAYPIYWAYESKCDYKDYSGNICQNGLINILDESKQREIIIPCPACASKKLVGPGSLIDKPVPRGEMKIDGPPVGIVGIDRNSLDYNVNEAERLKAQIVASATGKNKLLNKQAINQDQVESQFESQATVIKWIANNFSIAHKWVWDTVGKLRYGENYLGCSINYGTEFYLRSIDDAITDFKTSKDVGLPSYLLISKINAIEYLQAKNNPKEKNRLNILKNLEPYQFLTLKECKDNGIDLIDKEGFVLKANFANFVSRFELEFGSILEFGSKLDFSVKVERIAQKLYEYVSEKISKEPNSSDSNSEGFLNPNKQLNNKL